jgi:hypothetical protein
MTKLALIDVDGVIADDRHRHQFAIDKNYAEYFDADRMAADGVWVESVFLIESLVDDGYTIAYLTGRREDRRQVTEDWMDRNGFPTGRLIMRTFDYTMRLAEFKAMHIENLLGYYESVTLFDDDPEVVNHIQTTVGDNRAVFCGWNVKPTEMIKKAVA